MKAARGKRDLRSEVDGRLKDLTAITLFKGEKSKISPRFPSGFGTVKILARKRGSIEASMTSFRRISSIKGESRGSFETTRERAGIGPVNFHWRPNVTKSLVRPDAFAHLLAMWESLPPTG